MFESFQICAGGMVFKMILNLDSIIEFHLIPCRVIHSSPSVWQNRPLVHFAGTQLIFGYLCFSDLTTGVIKKWIKILLSSLMKRSIKASISMRRLARQIQIKKRSPIAQKLKITTISRMIPLAEDINESKNMEKDIQGKSIKTYFCRNRRFRFSSYLYA